MRTLIVLELKIYMLKDSIFLSRKSEQAQLKILIMEHHISSIVKIYYKRIRLDLNCCLN